MARTKTHDDVVSSQKLADLESTTTAAGLVASYAGIKSEQTSEILALVDVHGVESLTQAAKNAHRQSNPMLHVHGWLRLWRGLPIRRRPLPPTCGECDEYGRLGDDAHGRAVRCTCRRPAAA
ncbi:hypothetical protein [Rhodococcus chondri]|uniref:Transposase n=1 Tax=Rhodococcus chondri TaxID=3065941 RepID=A0ABU7JQW4_9NOCA|nr:hypothetical protein [Rhodococcus sp. CC-R104]MEE2031889.1 hypothetical protein [Rhodococcus sp. CC-R104]